VPFLTYWQCNSSSDVQKRLRALLPKDYAKEHRRFRPSSKANMELRSALIRHCKQGRVATPQHCINSKTRVVASSKACNNLDGAFEGPPAAFLNYSSRSPPLRLIPADSMSPNSQLTNSFLLMLDGSTLQEKSRNSDPPILIGPPKMTNDGRDALTQWRTEQRSGSELAPENKDSTKELREVRDNNTRPKLDKDYPESYLEHINTVLSSTESRRSSLGSLASFSSSWKPGKISITQEDSMSLDPVFKSDPTGLEFGTQEFFSWLSKGEEHVWKELVDETQVEQKSAFIYCRSPIPTYGDISLTNRRCCTMPDVSDINFFCNKCGFTQTHHFAIISLGRVLRNPKLINQSDSFGNSPLHCAVVGGLNFTGVRYLIESGAKVQAVNSFGETFMHLIQFIPPGGERDYIEMLKLLESLNFHFSQRDFHGRTILHKLLEMPYLDSDDIEALGEIFDIFKPDFAAVDNSGRGIFQLAQEYLSKRPLELTGGQPMHHMLPYRLLRSNRNTSNSCKWRDMWNMPQLSHMGLWLRGLDIVEPATWVDTDGDTILSAVLKLDCWEDEKLELRLRDTVQELLSLGAELNMRDMNGDTALAIATKRGFRPVVSVLLNAGANPNTRNYNGTGILSQATLCRIQAAKGKRDRLHAMILSCSALLVDSGARVEPTQSEEWMSLSARTVRNAL
jgi:ankyrin repeat protein